VIAPHNDDEVLGAGGAIQRHLRRGDPVSVVLLTNGDGQYRGPRLSRRRAVRLGYLRQEETLRALSALGLPERCVYFLGYPDRGLARLWSRHWPYENPYRAPQTGATRSPYENSFTPGAPYCGEALTQDLMEILRRERPHIIYLPHPCDTHPDHRSACAFTLYALQTLKEGQDEPSLALDGQVQLLGYLIHFEPWPLTQGRGMHKELRPPRPLIQASGTRWRSLPLTPEEVKRKKRALLCHRSQMRMLRPYLLSFVRRNELFEERSFELARVLFPFSTTTTPRILR
jgi:LmbE family N-acetylglucosaminyl deacetylase